MGSVRRTGGSFNLIILKIPRLLLAESEEAHPRFYLILFSLSHLSPVTRLQILRSSRHFHWGEKKGEMPRPAVVDGSE